MESTKRIDAPRLFFAADAEELAKRAASRVVEIAQRAIAARSRFVLALAGGSTPELLYRMLVERYRDVLDWRRVEVFFGDERLVALDDPRSNFAMAQRTLLRHVAIPESRVHAVPVTLPPEQAAAQYEQSMLATVPPVVAGGPPAFDLILLGIGSDGHVASLFPGAPTLDAVRQYVAAAAPGVLPPPVDRITVTLPVVNAAGAVIVLVAGESKSEVVARALQRSEDPHMLPICGVRPIDGDYEWFLDQAAAKRLSTNTEK
ncbi:MAG: 6-phosphogluconolactonase [Planctomycetes bacterium]|nr:6-phosphogluconolactonase [Planctomycetota bacterium]